MHKKIDINDIERYYPPYEKGLTSKQVRIRNEQKLNNKVKDNTKVQYFQIIVKNLFTFYNILLLTIGGILLYAKEYTNCFFMIVVIANTLIGLIQDLRAKIKLDNLSLIDEKKIEVVRDGKIKKVNLDQIVLDDIVHLRSGEQIPCDAFVLSGEAEVDESVLTGESLPLHKIASSKLLSGSYLLSGELYVKVTAVGKDNYIKKIQAKTKDYKAPKSQMFLQLNRLFKAISGIVIFLGVCTIASKGLLNNAFSSFEEFNKNVATIAGALISMIPSGMYLLISTTLTVGVIDLSNKKVLVQDMYSIETLARVDTLCIDKTGTLTDGNMSVYDVVMLKDNPFNKDKLDVVVSSFLNATNDDNFTAKGLAEYFTKKPVFEKMLSISFDSHLKYSSATLKEIGTITIGAFGFVPLKDDNEIKARVEEESKKGYRVLVVGYSKDPINKRESPRGMIPIALILMQDHIRKNAPEIIKKFIDNGVDIKVISGDNPLTVQEIARAVGITNSDKIISLENMTDAEVIDAATKYNVFGRVSPEQKELIVDTLKAQKKIVGMFGDGVNDILALKASNVGITVGCASKAAKDVASIILYTNDFGSLPEVITQGRRVINNLQRTCSLFLIKTLFAIVVNVFFLITSTTPMKLSYPFIPANFYGWDVIGVGIAAFFLALEKNNDEIVKGGFLHNIFSAAMLNGLVIAFEVMALFLYSYFTNMEHMETVTIAVYFISLASFVSLFEVSYKFDFYRATVFICSIVGTTLMFVVTYLTPFNVVGIDRHANPFHIALGAISLIIIMILICGTLFGIKKYKEKKKEIKND